jgi:hypothetical protein
MFCISPQTWGSKINENQDKPMNFLINRFIALIKKSFKSAKGPFFSVLSGQIIKEAYHQ